MFNILALLFIMLTTITSLHAGTGVHYIDTALTGSGKPIVNAPIRVCIEPVTTTNPCTPLATIYSDIGLTQVKLNPFTADSLGNFDFYANSSAGLKFAVEVSCQAGISGCGPQGAVSTTRNVCLFCGETMQRNNVFVDTSPIFNFIEGSGISLTATPDTANNRTNLIITTTGPAPSGALDNHVFEPTPTFDAGSYNVFLMTLTGNVTMSTVSNSSTGQRITFLLCQDGTGNRTFVWPTTFLRPPTISGRVSECTNTAFLYNGANWVVESASGDNTQVRALDNKLFASQSAGADAGAKIAACMAALPAGGGTCDARGLNGSQTLGTLTLSKAKTVLLLGAGTYSGSILLADNDITIQGSGTEATTIAVAASATGIGNANTAASRSRWKVRDLSIDLQGDSAIGIDACGLNRGEFTSSRITSSGGTTGQVGMKFRCGDTVSSYSNNVVFNEFQSILGKAVEITDAGNDTRITHNNILQGAQIGIEVDGIGGGFPDAIWIAFNRFDGADGGTGIKLGVTGAVYDVTIESNRFEAVAGTWKAYDIYANAGTTRVINNWYTGGTLSDAGNRTLRFDSRAFGGGVNALFDFVWRQNFQLKNSDNAAGVFSIDSGSTAEQATQIFFKDRGTSAWVIQKSSGGFFHILDTEDANRLRLGLTTLAATDLNSAGANPVRFNFSGGTGTGGTQFGDGASGIVASVNSAGKGTFASFGSNANCSDSAGDAACGAAPSGSVVIDAADTTTVVLTTAVTANSQIIIQRDNGLGARLSVTCNTQADNTLGTPFVSARTAATSFTITVDTGPTTDPMCVSYFIVN